jgi:CHAT domain-containing protein
VRIEKREFMKWRMSVCAAVLLVVSLSGAAQDKKDEVGTLVPGQTVERMIKGGETHAYLINLHQGEFMHLEVDQRGIDVVVSLFAPDRTRLVEMNNRHIDFGQEPLSFAADVEGSYRFEVRAATAWAIEGRYAVHLNELRGVTASDRIRIEAERTAAEGQRLRVQGTAESYRGAKNEYETALKKWGEVNDRYWEATTLTNIGLVYDNLNENRKALEFYDQALPLERAVGDKPGEALTLNYIGNVYSDLGEQQKALEFYNPALPIERALGDKVGEANTLFGIGVIHSDLGEKQTALEFLNQALSIERAVGDRSGEARTLHGIGIVYDDFSEKQKALEFYNQALPIRHLVGDKSGEAATLISIGVVYSDLGEKQKALEFYNQALPLKRLVGDKSGEGSTLNNIGVVYRDLGELQKALEFYNQALPLKHLVGDRAGEANTLNNIGVAYRDLGEPQKALEFYNQALPLNHVVDRSGEADTLIGLGNVYDDLGETQKASEFYNQALPIKRAVGDRTREANILHDLMLLWKHGAKPALAVFYGKQAVNVLQQLRADISGLEKRLQYSFLHSKEDTYRQLADILISHGRLSEAEEVLALLKDEEYSSLRSRGDPRSAVDYSPAETEAVTALDRIGELGLEADELRDHKQKNLLDDKGQQRLNHVERELLPQANARFRLALAAIEKEAPKTVVKTAEVKEGQSLMRYLRELGRGTVVLYTVVSTESGKSSKGWVILVTPAFPKAYEMDVADLDQTVAAFRQTLRSDKDDPRPLAQKLYRMIFLKPQKEGKTLAADLAAYLRNQKEKTLMWSLDGVLRYVPMAALHDGDKYLVENYRNVVFTPASLPGLTHATSRKWNVLGLGVAKKYEGFTALSGVPKELSAIVRDGQKHTSGVLPGTIKWDDEFKEDAMMDSLSEGYNVVHIASHFSYQAAQPEKSFLLLGDGGHLEVSRIQDLTTLFEKADLVTLSACDTAVGSAMKDANGKDVEGFAYVAQKLGAMAVIASLWPVDDIGTQVLMPKFYSLHQSGLNKAEGLRQAQLSLLHGDALQPASDKNQKRAEIIGQTPPGGASAQPPFKADPKAPYAHPYYWAPFILIGNWK